jgi:hypothetical protein
MPSVARHSDCEFFRVLSLEQKLILSLALRLFALFNESKHRQSKNLIYSNTDINIVSNSSKSDLILPLSRPIRDVNGKLLESIFVPKGTMIFVNIMGINRSRDIWGDDSNEWKPERWLEPLPESVTDSHIPGVYMNS